MLKQKIITLKKANKVFPNEVTRMRAYDLISRSIDKKQYLTAKEQEKLQNLASKIRKGLFKYNRDILIMRRGKRLTIMPL